MVSTAIKAETETHQRLNVSKRGGGPPPPDKKSIARLLVELALTVLVVVAVLETTFAIAGIGEDEYLKPDPVIGATGIPNKAVTHRKEGFGRFRYNSFGFQDYERTLAKPANTKRIAVLGDSLVESLQVDRKQNFCNLLEAGLNSEAANKHQKERFEVLNFGVSMSNLAQMYLRTKHVVLPFHPDLVIVPVRVDAALQLSPNPKGGFLFARPNYFAIGNGDLLEDRTLQKLWLSSPEGKRMRSTEWLREHSRIWGVISVGVEQLAGWLEQAKKGAVHWGADVTDKQTAFVPGAATPVVAQSATASAPSEVTANRTTASSTAKANVHNSDAPGSAGVAPANKASSSPIDSMTKDSAPLIKQAVPPHPVESPKSPEIKYYDGATRFEWNVADPLIKRIKTECDEHGCKLMLLRMPGGNNWRNELETRLLYQTAQRYGIPLCDATDAFYEQWIQFKQLWYDTHFTPLSHEIMADELCKFIHEKGLDQ